MHHREEGFVKMTDRLYAIGLIQPELGTRLAQSCTVLGGCDDGDVEQLAWRCWSAASEHGHVGVHGILARSSFWAVEITFGNS
jgi:hypothetical protein